MKTINHPAWHCEPLRLTPAETQDPHSVLENFFQSYHLQDVREIMWQWVTEAVSSHADTVNDPHERNNHLFFYEKIEALVEAAWIMKQCNSAAIEPSRLPPEKRDRTMNAVNPKLIKQPAEKETRDQKEKFVNTSQPTRFSKPARLIEKATTQPVEVIYEVFDQINLGDLTDYLLPNWLRVAMINTQSPYSFENGREILYDFYELLVPFVTQLFTLSDNQQFTNPATLFTDFFQQFSIDYLRRELADFLEAGIGHDGAYPNGFSPWQAWLAYNHVLCLIEAAYQLYLKQQVLSVVNAMPRELEVVDV